MTATIGTPARPDRDTLLERSYTFERDDTPNDGRTLFGHAAVFDRKTRIDSWEGRFDEKIAPGAFAKTLRERQPKLMFNHGRGFIGDLPIGAFTTLQEDKRGLYVEARLHDNMWVEPIRQAIESGAIEGMSFRFQVIREEWDPAPPWEMPDGSKQIPLRTLVEVKLAEAGPVVFPAYPQTNVGVRSLDVPSGGHFVVHDEQGDEVKIPSSTTRSVGLQELARALVAQPEARDELARLVIDLSSAPSSEEGTREENNAPSDDAAEAQGTSSGEPRNQEEQVEEAAPQAFQTQQDRLRVVAAMKGMIHESPGEGSGGTEGSD